MKFSMLIKKMDYWGDTHRGSLQVVVVVIAVVGLILTAMSGLRDWVLAKVSLLVTVPPAVLAIAREYSEMVSRWGIELIIIALFVCILLISLRLSNLERLTVILLDKSVAAKLISWDYVGQWSLDGDALSVTNSDDGGLLKTGATWEDYDFLFDFKIKNECGAWIVRAESLHKYVMIQCNEKGIRPHMRIVQKAQSEDAPPDPERGFKVLKDYPHLTPWTEWNRVKTEVRGHAIRVLINERVVFEDHSLLKEFPIGRVGFRCSGNEHALFKEIRVIHKRYSPL